MTADELVHHRVADGVSHIRLDDPASRNALSPAMSLGIAAAVADAIDRESRAIVLVAAPPVFCSGGSLDELLQPTHPLDDAYAGFEALLRAPVPTMALVDGAVVGAGVNLVLACDVVVATPDARFDPRFLDVGIHPGGGHLLALAQRVGRQGAAALALLGDALTGEEAAAAGLVWRCLPAADAEALVERWAQRVVDRPDELVRRTKSSLDASLADPSRAAAVERAAQEWSMGQPFFAERVRALKERLSSR